MLGLPDTVRACLFDLDGVLTDTATVHARAWKTTFDDYLARRARRTGERLEPFDALADYDRYVDGRPRADGVAAFLAARGIELPRGDADDLSDAETVNGIGNAKNRRLLALLRTDGVTAFAGSVRFVRAARDVGLRRAVVSASANCADVLHAARIAELFEVRVDGALASREHLRGKPAPDTFLAGARVLGVAPEQAAVFEDALAGVAAGRAGGFACVVGVDRVGQAAELRKHGADVVVSDLAELLDS